MVSGIQGKVLIHLYIVSIGFDIRIVFGLLRLSVWMMEVFI